jgi:integrase
MAPPRRRNPDLPPRLQRRRSASGARYYYQYPDKRLEPLGASLPDALARYAEIERAGRSGQEATVASLMPAYLDYLRAKVKPSSHATAARHIRMIARAFVGPLSAIKPIHVNQYLRARSAPVAANREIKRLGHFWKWARAHGHVDGDNPCTGSDYNQERPRERVVTPEEYQAMWQAAAPELQDLLDLCLLTGQRPGDVLSWRRDQIRGGCLELRQSKTGPLLRIEVTGELAAVIARAQGRQRAATGPWIVQSNSGQRMTKGMVERRLTAARAASGQDWQIRDLRRTAATESESLQDAQALLGHATSAMTRRVYRKGDRVKPLR